MTDSSALGHEGLGAVQSLGVTGVAPRINRCQAPCRDQRGWCQLHIEAAPSPSGTRRSLRPWQHKTDQTRPDKTRQNHNQTRQDKTGPYQDCCAGGAASSTTASDPSCHHQHQPLNPRSVGPIGHATEQQRNINPRLPPSTLNGSCF